MKKAFREAGFTLIEILVVISIIGILVAILYPSFNEARDDARNKALQTELKETKLALELYKAQNGKYPAVPANPCGSNIPGGRKANSTTAACSSGYMIGLTPEYVAALPSHKLSGNSNCNISYQVSTDGSWYKLTAERCHAGAATAAEGVRAGSEFARYLSSCAAFDSENVNFYESYAVYSAGGECR